MSILPTARHKTTMPYMKEGEGEMIRLLDVQQYLEHSTYKLSYQFQDVPFLPSLHFCCPLWPCPQPHLLIVTSNRGLHLGAHGTMEVGQPSKREREREKRSEDHLVSRSLVCILIS